MTRIALVHDSFTQRGGGERVAERLAQLYPEAEMFTSVIDPAALPPALAPERVVTSRVQSLFAAGVPLRALYPLIPPAFRAFDFSGYDAVVSSSASVGHLIPAAAGTAHLCYCHTPPAFLHRADYFPPASPARVVLAPALGWARRVDRRAAARVDRYIANSRFTAARIRAAYGIDADVLYPPIDTGTYAPTDDSSGRFLVVSRLRPRKAIDLAIGAANLHGLPLDIIGEGSDRARLERLAGPTVRFLGWRSDAERAEAMARCVALLVPGVEDFGMVSAEVQAAGRPPIGSAIGGTTEIVADGVTGFLVGERTAAGFGAAMRRAQREPLDRNALLASAARFDVAAFATALDALIEATCLDRMQPARSAPW